LVCGERLKPTDLCPEALKTAGRNAVLLKEAEAIESALEAKGVPALFLKGIALLETAYPDLTARSMADIDLLVLAQDLEEVSAVLRRSGDAPRPNAMVLSKSVGKIRVDIDLHADLWFFGSDQPWRRSRAQDTSTGLRTLCPEDAILHCILHSMIQDGGVSPQALVDCRAILDREAGRFSWDAFAATVAEEGWEKPVASFLRRLEATYPGSVPRSRCAGGPAQAARTASIPSAQWPYLRMLRMQSRWRRRIQLLLDVLFPHPSFLKMRYPWVPSRPICLLRLLRPFLLLGESISCRLDSFRL
jgi:hypothetical protein